jgi:hypothetical protein
MCVEVKFSCCGGGGIVTVCKRIERMGVMLEGGKINNQFCGLENMRKEEEKKEKRKGEEKRGET